MNSLVNEGPEIKRISRVHALSHPFEYELFSLFNALYSRGFLLQISQKQQRKFHDSRRDESGLPDLFNNRSWLILEIQVHIFAGLPFHNERKTSERTIVMIHKTEESKRGSSPFRLGSRIKSWIGKKNHLNK
jgi:hypothetical protein